MADERSETLTRWMDGYLRAWSSNAPDDIRALFTEDARYFTDPWTDPWSGRDSIVEEWIKRDDQPGTWEFTWSPVAVTEEVAVVQGETRYTDGRNYSNLWLIRLSPDGRAREFTEYWMDQADPS
jgi:ketosteroid isomerase-like protein